MGDLTVSVAEILGHPGAYRDVRVAAEIPGVRIALARLAPGPAAADLRLESVVEGVLVTGSAAAATSLECSRCLTRFAGELEVDVCELFAAPGHTEGDDDVYRISGMEIELEPLLRDALALALPLKPLCNEACKGLCARCGRDLNEGPCECKDDEIDPRWAALTTLRDRLESQED